MSKIEKLYACYNKLYFGNKLPKIPVRFKKMRDHGYTIIFDGYAVGIYINKEHKIWGKICCITLLHEMVHVKFPKEYHGKKFQKEMKRLIRAGAFDEYLM